MLHIASVLDFLHHVCKSCFIHIVRLRWTLLVGFTFDGVQYYIQSFTLIKIQPELVCSVDNIMLHAASISDFFS